MDKELKLKVAYHQFKPIVFHDGVKLIGFETELLESVANSLNWHVEMIEEDGLQSLINKTASGEYDLAYAGITRTSDRADKLNFSFNTLSTGLSIAVPSKYRLSFKKLLSSLFSKNNLLILSLMLLFAFFSAHVLWFFEKGISVSEKYVQGVFDSFWWSIVTFSTVGYGDISPETVAGKIVGIVAILSGLAIFGIYVGQISSTLLSEAMSTEIKHSDDLSGKRVGVKEATTAETYVKKIGAETYSFKDVESALDALSEGKLDAVVADYPSLYLLSQHKKQVKLLPLLFARQSYAFAFPKMADKNLINQINMELIKMRENGVYDKIYEKYFD